MTTEHTRPNGHTASDIMANPAGAAGTAPAQTHIVSPQIADPGTARLLDQLPGLVGAIDMAIKDTVGKPLGFMLMVFADGVALHACNVDPREGQQAAADLVRSWELEGRGEEASVAIPQDATTTDSEGGGDAG